MKRFLIAILLIAALGSAAGWAQVDPSAEQGVHAFGSYDASKVDAVNLQNGAVSFKIPLFSYPERGKFGASVELVMSSKQWTVNETCNQFTGSCGGTWYINRTPLSNTERAPYPTLTGVGVVIDDGVPALGSVETLKEQPNGTYREVGSWVAVDSDGSTHPILGGSNGSTIASTVDGSGIIVNVAPTSSTMVSRNGVSSVPSSTPSLLHIEDSNGNIEQNIATGTVGQDSIGRNGLYAAFLNAQTTTDSSGCPTGSPLLPIANVQIVTFPGYNGSTRQLKLCSVSVPGQTGFDTTFNDPGNPGDGAPITEGTNGGYVLQSVVLYNGTA